MQLTIALVDWMKLVSMTIYELVSGRNAAPARNDIGSDCRLTSRRIPTYLSVYEVFAAECDGVGDGNIDEAEDGEEDEDEGTHDLSERKEQ